MMKTLKSVCDGIRAHSLLFLFLGAVSGCGGPKKAGESDYSGLSGNLTSREAADLTVAVVATKRAMESLSLRPMITDKDGFSAKIIGEVTKGALDQSHELLVRLKSISETETEIEMGIRGRRDEAMLQRLLAEIRKELKAGAGEKK